MGRRSKGWIVLSLVLFFVVPLGAQTLRIAAAADLQLAMNDLAGRYGKATGQKVSVSFGSSGNFRTQIENGAPFDLFFSADGRYPKLLISAGLADADTFYVYAHGRLVLWSPAGVNLQLEKRGLRALSDSRVTKIAIANPEHAPYGRAAVAALQKAGLYEEVKPKLVYGENISQAAQFAQSGSAQVGILALSLTYADSMKSGECWEVPAELYPALEQAAVVVHAAANKRAAQAFLEYVKGPEAKEILARYGFMLEGVPAKP
jgi:molybdate transport system substrate-binding protein